jgi:hypothetical protein
MGKTTFKGQNMFGGFEPWWGCETPLLHHLTKPLLTIYQEFDLKIANLH